MHPPLIQWQHPVADMTIYAVDLIQIFYFIDNVCMAYFLMEMLNHETETRFVLLQFTFCITAWRNCNAYIESKVHILVPFLFYQYTHYTIHK